MLLADLKSMAAGMGISGTSSMKKAQLVDAIRAAQSGAQAGAQSGQSGRAPQRQQAPVERTATSEPASARDDKPSSETRQRTGQETRQQDDQQDGQPEGSPTKDRKDGKDGKGKKDRPKQQDQAKQDQGQQDRPKQEQEQAKQEQAKQEQAQGDSQGEGTSRRNRRRRGRDRQQTQTNQGGAASGGQSGGQSGQAQAGRAPRNEPDTTILDDDVLVPAAGILDVLDNYAFVRTSGYLPGPEDVYVSLSMVRKYGLRRGDAIVGQVRHPREGERKEKFNPMVRIDGVNGTDPDSARHRADFATLTPVHPSQRLRLETDPANLVGRILDLVAPLGKGQRGLIVSPARAGKTTVLQSIAHAVTVNNPECHLMVVLVDERPEEVTAFQRSVKGEVIASTFDRPPADHTTVAELALERAKRLVELGHDVVVLLDGITRLGRAYNLSVPSSGRTILGAVDAGALYPPKRFFGAARNIENGGSLTMLATATVDSGSTIDEVLFEGLQGTSNLEVRLSGELAAKRRYPAIDLTRSATRHDDLLMFAEERQVVGKLRALLVDLEPEVALEVLLERLRGAPTNLEVLRRVQ